MSERPTAENDGLCHEFIDTGRCGHSDAEHDAMADGQPAEPAAHRLARIRRSANAAMAGVGPKFQPDREDVFRVADVLWLLDQLDATRPIPPGSAAP